MELREEEDKRRRSKPGRGFVQPGNGPDTSIKLINEGSCSITGVLCPRRPVLIGGRLQVCLLYRQSRMYECHLMMMVMVVVMMVVLLMTRRRRRIGIPSDSDVHDIDLRWYDDGRRLRRGLYLLRATDRVATSFAASSRPTNLTFSYRCAAVPGRRCSGGGRDARRFHDFMPVRFTYRWPGQQVVPV